jgi:2-polyprenyl-6-methoxyphenol hydroxylase-like FAD-dependent oxidoreductase
MAALGKHAVVLGASISGLLAARVLADFFDSVTVIERDALGDGAENRRGVPQGRHLHGLLMRGSQVLAELFPGILDELVAAGAPHFDGTDVSRMYLCMNGHLLVRSGDAERLGVYGPSRPLLESHIRRRVRCLGNVTLRDAYDVVDLTSTSSRERVTGVRVAPHGGGEALDLISDLVVDATGRGARTPAFLEALGYRRPTEQKVTVDLKYSSQLLRLPQDALTEVVFLITPVAGRPSGLAMARCEDDNWMLTVAGMAGNDPPDTFDEICDFAADILPAYALAAVRSATPLGPTAQHRYPSSRWHRYDRLRRLPDGLLAVGDAVCSFNPIYAQGMTVAALQALALRESLSRGTRNLPQRFYAAGAKPIRQAWQQVVGNDLSLPEIVGTPPLTTRLINPYVERVLSAAEHDLAAMEAFMRVVWLVDPPPRLMRPTIVARALTAGRRSPEVASSGHRLAVLHRHGRVVGPAQGVGVGSLDAGFDHAVGQQSAGKLIVDPPARVVVERLASP